MSRRSTSKALSTKANTLSGGAALLLALAILCATASAQQWNHDAGGDWSDATRWDPQSSPNAADAVAKLMDKVAPSVNRMIQLAGSVTLQELQIDSAKEYQVSRAMVGFGIAVNRITVTNANGNASHYLSAPLQSQAGDLTVSVTNTEPFRVDEVIGAGGLVKQGEGTLVLKKRGTYAGDTRVEAGRLEVDHPQALPGSTKMTVNPGASLRINSGVQNATVRSLEGSGSVEIGTGGPATQFNISGAETKTFDGVISGSGDLRFNGGGTLTLTQPNTYAGETNIGQNSTIKARVADALPATTRLTVNGMLNLADANDPFSYDQTLATLIGVGDVVNGSNAPANLIVNNPQPGDSFDGRLVGKFAFSKDGAGPLQIKMANALAGPINVRAGDLLLSEDQSFDALKLGATSKVILNRSIEDAGMQIPQPQTLTTKELQGAAGAQLMPAAPLPDAAPCTLFLARNGAAASEFHGTISGDLRLQIDRNATLTLTGINSYAGGTTVGGTLIVNSNAATGTGRVIVDTRGALRGQGAIGGDIRIEDNGNVAERGIWPGLPGKSGKLEAGQNVEFLSGAAYRWTLSALSEANPGTDFSVLALTDGELSIDPQALVSLSFAGIAAPDAAEPFWKKDHSWKILTLEGEAENPNSGNFGSVMGGDFRSGKFSTSVADSGEILLNYTAAVPEPAAWLLALVAVAGLIRVRPRRV